MCREIDLPPRKLRIELGDSEVEHLYQPVRPDHDVLGLDVTVDHTGRVGRPQPGSHLDCHVDGFPDRQGTAAEARPQCASFDVLHRDEQPAIFSSAERVDRADVRVTQRGGRAGFLTEERDAIAVVGDVRWKELDRDPPIELEVAGEPDLTHSSASEESQDLIRVQAGAGTDVHRAMLLPAALHAAHVRLVRDADCELVERVALSQIPASCAHGASEPPYTR